MMFVDAQDRGCMPEINACLVGMLPCNGGNPLSRLNREIHDRRRHGAFKYACRVTARRGVRRELAVRTEWIDDGFHAMGPGRWRSPRTGNNNNAQKLSKDAEQKTRRQHLCGWRPLAAVCRKCPGLACGRGSPGNGHRSGRVIRVPHLAATKDVAAGQVASEEGSVEKKFRSFIR
jgi:hypothetical protein